VGRRDGGRRADGARERVDGEFRSNGTRERVDGAAFRTRPVGVMQTGAQSGQLKNICPEGVTMAGALWATEEQTLEKLTECDST
jgi:hypothetical protein